MKKTLGLDLGSNSLGWAILDDITGDILDKGVLVFPEGVDLDAGSSLETPAAIRRAARMARRMKFRRKLRKWHLLKILIDVEMCPLTHAELEEWKKTGRYPLGNKAFLEWLKATDASNPYCDRAAAASGKVPPLTLGRALYHIAQRRGFKSSRKDETDLADETAGQEKLLDKKLGAVKTDIETLTKEIEAAGCKTLGQYFFKRLQDEKEKLDKTRIRCRYTGRIEHYEKEFSVIMDAQGYAADEPLRKALFKAIFMQRPLRSQAHLVGPCPLEPHNPRVQIGHPAFEEFRMLAFVNNLSLEDGDGNCRDEQGNLLYPLSAKDRETICSVFMKAAPSIKFGDVVKLFKKDPRFKSQGLKFHYYRPDDSVTTCQTRHKIRSAFGSVPYDEQKVFDALTFFDDNDKLGAWFRKHFPTLDEAAVKKLVSIHPKEGNASYSLKAINKMLPFLRKGFELSQARFLAKLPDVIPDFATNEQSILQGLEEARWAFREARRRYGEMDSAERRQAKSPMLFDFYREYLLNNWNVTEEKWNRLYLRGEGTYVAETEYDCKGKKVRLAHPRLPPVQLGMIRNPLVQRSMTTLRRLVNYLGDHGKLEPSDTVRIELARSVNDFATRKAWQDWQKARQRLRAEAAAEIAKLGVAVTEDAVDRYVLWKEQDAIGIYTHRTINVADLFVGNKFDIEHTIPRSLSGDDSLANKTICEAAYNRQTKQGRIPRECPNWEEIDTMLRPWREKVEQLEKTYRSQTRSARAKTDPAQRSLARVKALTTKFELSYWRDKLRRFEITSDKLQSPESGLGGFKKRQLVDTGIMCSHAVELLRCVYPATFSVNGAATAFARKAWGIQDDEAKDRTEHTHHAKDAMVIAALTPARFTAICTALKDDGAESRRECDVCPPPYEGFAEKVRHACEEILVKHVMRQTTLRQSSKRNVLAKAHTPKGNPEGPLVKAVLSRGDTVRGELHNQTYYGKIRNPQSGAVCTVQRVPIEGMQLKDIRSVVPKIVDPAIRSIIESSVERLASAGISAVRPGDIMMPSGVPIRKVRIIAPSTFQNPDQIKEHSHVSSKPYKRFLYAGSAGSVNFRMAIYYRLGKYSYKTESKLHWAQKHKLPGYVLPDREPGFIGYVYPGSMVLIRSGLEEDAAQLQKTAVLASRLYYLRTLPTAKERRCELQSHVEARAKKDIPNNDKSSAIDVNVPKRVLRITANDDMFKKLLFEGIHFRMMLDGSIQFIKK